MTAVEQIAHRHFGSRRTRQLAKKGVRLMGLQNVGGDACYVIDDNGTGRVLTFKEVCAL